MPSKILTAGLYHHYLFLAIGFKRISLGKQITSYFPYSVYIVDYSLSHFDI